MNIKFDKINELPVKTWRWLGVNSLSLDEVIPDITPYKKESVNWGPSDKELLLTKDSNPDLDYLYDIPTGVGEEAVDFIRKHKNAELSLVIPNNLHLDEPIFIHYELDEENPTLINLSRIIANENSRVNIVIIYKNKNIKKPNDTFHAGLTLLHAKRDAIINLTTVQLFDDHCIHLDDCATLIEDHGTINIHKAELGGGKIIWGLHSHLKGDYSNQFLNSIYFGDKERFIDINYIADHMGKFSKSEMMLNGALLDHARKLFRGTIDFKRGAVGAVGEEEEFNLLFSPNTKNITAPLILCGEEHVEGKHGANSGKVQEDQLFYMMSRGISEQDAKKIMIESVFLPVINAVPDKNIQEDIKEYVKGRLANV